MTPLRIYSKSTLGKLTKGLPDAAEAMVRCCWYSACIALLPAPRVASLAARIPAMRQEGTSGKADAVARVRRAISRVERFWPLAFSCLAMALAARAMLAVRGCSAELHLGLARDGKRQLKAHAWLSVGRKVVSGRSGHRQYRLVGKFA